MKVTKRGCSYCTGFLALVTFTMVFFSHTMIDSAINAEIPKKAMMTSSNIGLWGKVPGDLNVIALINFTFFNFTNSFEALYLNQTPEFVETPMYTYQNFQEALLPNFSKDAKGNGYVEFHPYQWYKPYGTVNEQDKVIVPNLGPLVAWNNMKAAPRSKIAIEALINLADAFETQMGGAVTARSVWTAFVMPNKTAAYEAIFQVAGVSQATFEVIWSDGNFGWMSQDTFSPWIIAAIEGVNNVTSRVLMEYFDLTLMQMAVVLNGQVQSWMKMMNVNIANMFNCTTTPCDPKYLSVLTS